MLALSYAKNSHTPIPSLLFILTQLFFKPSLPMYSEPNMHHYICVLDISIVKQRLTLCYATANKKSLELVRSQFWIIFISLRYFLVLYYKFYISIEYLFNYILSPIQLLLLVCSSLVGIVFHFVISEFPYIYLQLILPR